MSRLILVDGNSLIFRAYHATAYTGEILRTSKGVPTNALLAFINMFKKILAKKPTHIAVTFDLKEPTFRHKVYSDYKAGRKAGNPELFVQFDSIKRYLTLQGVACLEKPGYESDDIIGSIAKNTPEIDEVIIYSSDRDLLQLVDKKTTVALIKKGMGEIIEHTPEVIFKEYGLEPLQLIDLKALQGDTSDNIKGVAGIGKVTALKLIQTYGSVTNLYEHISELKGAQKTKLEAGKADAELSYFLGKIYTDKLFSVEVIQKQPADEEGLQNFFREFELSQLYKEKAVANNTSTSVQSFQYATEEKEIAEFLKTPATLFAEYTEKDELIHFALFNKISYLFLKKEQVFSSPSFLAFLKSETKLVVFNLKRFIKVLLKSQIEFNFAKFDCALLLAYCKDAENGTQYFNYLANTEFDDLIEVPKAYDTKSDTSLDLNTLSKKVKLTDLAFAKLQDELKDTKRYELYHSVELPLSLVLAKMENTGVLLDTAYLKELKSEFEVKLAVLKSEINRLAGYDLNPLSPKQIAKLLYEDLGLKQTKKTAKGAASTDSETLTEYAEVYPIVKLILEYRTYAKILQTYAVGLLDTVDNENTVHTTYNQTQTATGRLSSFNPNLQNIPTHSELGSKIKNAFVARTGFSFLSLDYSQIELRVLASISADKNMLSDFSLNKDIHTATAMRIFNTKDIDKEQRHKAKAINFGLIYGMSAYGLSKALSLDIKTADQYIKTYFAAYPEVLPLREKQIQDTKTNGFTETLFGRRRYLDPETLYFRRNPKLFERLAINSPIQGTAADILKISMLKISKFLKDQQADSKMLMQIHDELIFEIKEGEEHLISEIKKIMTDFDLNVPLVVSESSAKRWIEV